MDHCSRDAELKSAGDGISGMLAGLVGAATITHFAEVRPGSKTERVMNHPAFPLIPRSVILLAGTTGHLSGRTKTGASD